MKFRDLSTWDLFTMSGTSFDLGKTYQKLSALGYVQVQNGRIVRPTYKVGSINVEVTKVSYANS